MKKYTIKNLMQEYSSRNSESVMTQEKIDNIVEMSESTEVIEREKGYILFKYLGTKMELYSDEDYNRMRIIAPITEYSSLAPKIKDSLMDSNFHLALDARYGVSDDILFAAFLHPLSSLNTQDLQSALNQVYNLSASFGKTYRSAQLEFTKKK